MWRKRTSASAALQPRYPNAQVYGETEAGGLGVVMVLPDDPEVLELPANPAPPPTVTAWQKVVQPATMGFTGLGIVVTGFAAVIARRNHMQELRELHSRTPEISASQSQRRRRKGESIMATQTETLSQRKVLRYRVGPRINHAVLATSFILLLVTGLMLLWAPLAQYAAGGGSRLLHRIGAVLFMAVPILYLLVDRPAAKELLWDSFHYDKDDVAWLKHFFRYFFGHAAEMPPQGRLNAGQKLHHAAVVLASAVIVASGLILWFAKGNLGADGLPWPRWCTMRRCWS